MNIEICIHCYRYSKMLNLLLSSYVLHGGNLLSNITHIIYTCEEDPLTISVCQYFSQHLNIEMRLLPFKNLAARGYGRNLAVSECKSDWIWFSDADHLISKGSLESLFSILENTQMKFVYPWEATKNKNSEDVDHYLETIQVPNIIDFDFATLGMDTAIKHHRIPSGGVQIFKSEYIKQIGYAFRHKSMNDWGPCRDDKRARKRFYKFFPDSCSKIIIEGHRHLTHKAKRRNDKNAEL